MGLSLGDTAPDFEAETTEGKIKFHDWIGDSWAVLFSHPKDFTPVCTTELGYMAKLKPEFERRGVKVIGLSVDATTDHEKWAQDIEETQGARPNYPIIGDSDFNVSKLYGMLPASTSGDSKSRTPADNQTVRNVFVIGPDKKVKLILVYPMTTGRNFDEVLRVLDSLQLTAKHRVATPVNWKQGEDVIIAGSVPNDEAKQIFGICKEPKPTSASFRNRAEHADACRGPRRRGASEPTTGGGVERAGIGALRRPRRPLRPSARALHPSTSGEGNARGTPRGARCRLRIRRVDAGRGHPGWTRHRCRLFGAARRTGTASRAGRADRQRRVRDR